MTLPLLNHWFGAPSDDTDSRRHAGGLLRRAADRVEAAVSALSAEDAGLLARLASAEDAIASEALRELHTMWAAPLARYVEHLLLVPDRSDVADDIVQDVFVSVWGRRHALLSAGSVRAYLFGAVHRRSSQWLRNSDVAHRWAERAAQELVTTSQSVAPDPARLEVDELTRLLHDAIATLAPRQREALLLYRERELPLAEVAAIMGISVNTVKVQLHRAGAKLRAVAEAYLG